MQAHPLEDDTVVHERILQGRNQNHHQQLVVDGNRGPVYNEPQPEVGDTLNQYEEPVHAEAEQNNPEAVKESHKCDCMDTKREEFLETLNGLTITFTMEEGDVLSDLPLKPIAAACDTIYTLAGTWSQNYFSEINTKTNTMDFPLRNFPKEVVEEFVALVLHQKSPCEVSSDAMIECSLLAHYLCADPVLKDLINVMIESINVTNCLMLCRLGELVSPVLFQRSFMHMMETIGDLEEADVQEDLTTEIHERLNVIQSSIQSPINQQCRWNYDSLDEYIATFAERIQYFRERLVEAKEQQEQAIQGTKSWIDVEEKIKHQEKRVQTLDFVLREQKKLLAFKK